MSESLNRPLRLPDRQNVAAPGVFAFSCGVILLYWLSILPPPEWLAVPGVLLFLAFGRRGSVGFRRLTVLASGLMVGLSLASWHARSQLAEVLPPAAEGKPLSVSGYLCDIPSPGSFNSLRFSFCVTRWHNLPEVYASGTRPPDLLRLAWYGHGTETLPGARLRLEVRLKRPHGTLNPVGFRYENWLFRKGYRATGSVRRVQADPTVSCSVYCQYRTMHLALAEWVQARFGATRHFALVSSLLIGYRGHMTQQHWDVLKATGTIHLVAISGLHLGLIALGAGFVCRRLLLALPVHCVNERTGRRLVFAAVVLCCVLYALAAGFTVPTRRALVMVIVGGWLILLARQSPVWQSYLIALALVLALDPFAPLGQGFWLSFAAVAVLIAVFSARLAGSGWLAGLLVAQISVFAGLWPVLVAFGQGQPLAGLAANLIAIPWVSLVVMPLLVTGGLITAAVPAAAEVFGPAFDLVLGLLWSVLGWLAHWQMPEIAASTEEIAVLSMLALFMVLAPLTGFRLVAVVSALLWLAYPVTSLPRNLAVARPEIRVWDVGQGLSVLVRHGRKVLVYDTGPAVPGVFSAVESTLLPNLQAEGIRRIDTLVISHADGDHAGGLEKLAEEIEIGRIVAGEPTIIQDRVPEVSVSPCDRATETLGALIIDYWQAEGDREGNDASCVLRIHHSGSHTEWILPGDITGRVEAAYLAADTDLPDADRRVVIAPHHGSRTSSSEAWVQGLDPDWVLYTAGYRHRYGHPHPVVTARYRRAGAVQLNTACSGSVLMTIADNRLVVKEMRDEAPFWISGPGLARDQCKIP
ncbi:DNA internalization-related competence protein ComEC/Rec2 [Marinobacter subterrani]|uniref:DNA internalization-like competence protein ComEC/Rec2 n=1 Tax=Marinobacter subterrani TaxID=1658765 RepID=A0A0J7JA02_9GAMM|nr:DNA internalization-related competence protein ComEC/Rec2 [Marinobacter subterrani]KMQ74711.1 DNA internalization-like competence protein ComEC/Rec2 [Marinobacter subterrani]